MSYNLEEILRNFKIEADISSYGNGHINDTYIVENEPKYILQKINTNVFKNPDEVMENILEVTSHLRKKIKAEGGDPDRETLTVIKTIDDNCYYKLSDDAYFRLYKFIDNAVSYDIVDSPDKLYSAGYAFGKFQNMLSDFPADKLFETIKDFHNTVNRFENLKQAIKEDKMGRLSSVKDEIEFALKREYFCDKVISKMAEGKIPSRVTHNDTKLNNVMLDKDTGEGVCVIDLDTVMPGSLLYDYGDALRFGANSAAEDERDLSKVWFKEDMFKAFSKGFLTPLSNTLTDEEFNLLPFSIKLMTYECGIRFLTDYLNGDTYFKIHYEDQNLARTRTQFKLIADFESKENKLFDELKKIREEISK